MKSIKYAALITAFGGMFLCVGLLSGCKNLFHPEVLGIYITLLHGEQEFGYL